MALSATLLLIMLHPQQKRGISHAIDRRGSRAHWPIMLIQRDKFSRNIMSNNVATRVRAGWRGHQSGDAAALDCAAMYGFDGGRKYLSQTERDAVMAASARLPEPEALFLLTLAFTGARVTEVLEVKPQAIQRDARLLAIRTLKRRRFSMRELHLPEQLVIRLMRYIEFAEIGGDLRIWHWCRQTAWRLVKRVSAEVGLTGRAASPRGMRHGYAVAAIHNDVPLPLLQRWMGHSRLSTTAIYLAVTRPDERGFAERMWAHLRLEADVAPILSRSRG